MQKTIETTLASLGGRHACIVLQLDEAAPGELVSLNSDLLFPAASLAKLPNLDSQDRVKAQQYQEA
jgi:beta-lactamase class A